MPERNNILFKNLDMCVEVLQKAGTVNESGCVDIDTGALMNGGVDEYHYLGWSRKVGSSIRSDVSGYNSVLNSRASVGKDCYLE